MRGARPVDEGVRQQRTEVGGALGAIGGRQRAGGDRWVNRRGVSGRRIDIRGVRRVPGLAPFVQLQVEAMQESRARMGERLAALAQALPSTSPPAPAAQHIFALRAALEADDKRLIDIMTALSFQDLVAQRVNKLAAIIDEVEHKLLQLVVVFGPYQKQATQQDQGKATQMLKQLEAAKTTAIDQDLADEILKQFGFN